MSSASPRRFPPPWTVREVAEAYCIYDATDRALAYVYFDTSERGANTERMTKDEARRIAVGIARLPGLLRGLGDDIRKRQN